MSKRYYSEQFTVSRTSGGARRSTVTGTVRRTKVVLQYSSSSPEMWRCWLVFAFNETVHGNN